MTERLRLPEFSIVVLVAGLAAVLQMAGPAAAAEPANLFPEGSCEFIENGAAKGWTLQPGAELKAEGANHYLQFSSADGKESAWALGTLKLKPEWEALQVTARLKATDLKPGPEAWHCAHCILNFRTADGKDAGFAESPKLRRDSDWVTQTVTVEIPKGAAALHLQPGLWAARGVMCLDDVVITPVEKPGPFAGPVVRLSKDTGFAEGQFETLTADGSQAQGWSEWPTVAMLVGEGGNHWARITNRNPTAMPTLRANLRLPPACKSLRLSVRLQARDLRCGPEPWQQARVVISPCTADGQPLPSLPGPALAQDSAWQTLETTLAVTPETRYLVLWVGLWQATGSLDVDDVQVTVIE
jgi:hypothetical protein